MVELSRTKTKLGRVKYPTDTLRMSALREPQPRPSLSASPHNPAFPLFRIKGGSKGYNILPSKSFAVAPQQNTLTAASGDVT